MDPDHVAILYVLDDSLGKEAVDLLVGAPCVFIEGDLTGVVVEEGPEDGICKARREKKTSAGCFNG